MNITLSGGYVDARIAELYDYITAYASRRASRRDIDFYADEAAASGGRVLELGCGTGRVLLPIARKGIEVTGLDLARPMLALLRKKLSQESQEVQHCVRLVHSDMCGFDIGKRYALVTVPFRAFQHLISVGEHLACLRCVSRHLDVGGRLILDLFQTNPGRMHDRVYCFEADDMPETQLPDGRRLRRAHRTVAFHRAEQYNDIEFAYYLTQPDGKQERLAQAFPFRYFFRYEVEHLLARCGFAIVDLLGNFDRSPLTDASPEMIFVARKCEDSLSR